MQKRVLVLGATGKLGKVLVHELVLDNYNLTLLVRNPQKLENNLPHTKIIEGDVTKEIDLRKAVINIDAVISVLGHV